MRIYVGVQFEPRDLWIGVYWTAESDIYRPYTTYRVWVCVLPTLPIRITWQREVESFKRFKRERNLPTGKTSRPGTDPAPLPPPPATVPASAVRPGEGRPWATVPSQQKTTPE